MDAMPALNVLHSIARALPGLYNLVIICAAIMGVAVTLKGLNLISQSNKAQQAPPGSAYLLLLIGPLGLSLGTLLNVASFTLFRQATNPVAMETYVPYESSDDFRIALYAITSYIHFFAWVLVARAVYVGATGAHNKRENWVFEALVLWALSGCCIGFVYAVDAVSYTMGQGAIGTEYLTF